MSYQYQTSLTTPKDCLCLVSETIFTLKDGTTRSVQKGNTQKGEWGEVQTFMVLNDKTYAMPASLKTEWVALAENQRYTLNAPLNTERIENLWQQKDKNNRNIFQYVAVGLTHYGGVAVWLSGFRKQVLVAWLHGEIKPITLEERDHLHCNSIEDICSFIKQQLDNLRKEIEKYPLPAPSHYEHMMQQFTYRFVPKLQIWNDDDEKWEDFEEGEGPELNYIEVKRFDGTFDRLHDGSILKYHEAGKPSHLTINWNYGTREYTAYFFFDHEKLDPLFRRLSMLSLEGRFDFVLQIDPIEEKFIPMLQCEDVPEPIELTEESVDILVFRNKFECYRSKHYHQEPKAWLWM